MTYLEAVALLHDIESKYDVMSVKYKGVSVWPFLRIWLLDNISVHTEVRASKSTLMIVFKSIFYGNIFSIFHRFDIWVLTMAERRKQIDGVMIQRICGSFSELPYKCLMIEKPSSKFGHYSKKQIPEHNIISESGLLALVHLLQKIVVIRESTIEHYDIINQIKRDYNIEMDFCTYIALLEAQKNAMNFALSITKKPKMVFFECPYSYMGYVWAFHNKGVKVIELQHGVLNSKHNAYNAKSYDMKLNPESICVYGIEEYNFFKSESKCYAPDVEMTGLYMLEKSDESFSTDLFKKERDQYNSIVVVSGQTGFENQLCQFIDTIASTHCNILFFYIPRNNDVNLSFESRNVIIRKGVNIYEYLKWADIHITISSTTSLEAHYFKTPTLFYDYQRMATSYYKKVFAPNNAVRYINSTDEFDVAFKELRDSQFEYREIFAHNHKVLLNNIINKYLRQC